MDANKMDEEVLRQTIGKAQEELASIEAQLAGMEALSRRKAILQALIGNAQALLGEGKVAVAAASRPGNGKGPLWQLARAALYARNAPMTAEEITDYLKRDRVKLHAKFAREIIRGAMRRRPEVFEGLGGGLNALKVWPQAVKHRKAR